MKLTDQDRKLIDEVQGGFYDLYKLSSELLFRIALAIKRQGIIKEGEEQEEENEM